LIVSSMKPRAAREAAFLFERTRVTQEQRGPITAEAYEAIKASLSDLDNPAPYPGRDGLIRVRLDRATFDRLGRLSRPALRGGV
jgi:hypothetical protein